MLLLLNTAVLPNHGVYHYRNLAVEEVRARIAKQRWVSYINSDLTAEALHVVTNKFIPLNQNHAEMEVGDEAIVVRLNLPRNDRAAYTHGRKPRLQMEWVLERTEFGLLTRLPDMVDEFFDENSAAQEQTE